MAKLFEPVSDATLLNYFSNATGPLGDAEVIGSGYAFNDRERVFVVDHQTSAVTEIFSSEALSKFSKTASGDQVVYAVPKDKLPDNAPV